MLTFTLTGTGTSQGVPVIGCTCEVCMSTHPEDKRLRTACVIQTENTVVAIDTGPDFRQQMLRLKPPKVDAVLFTHPHKDHTAGLDDIRPFFFRQKKAMPIYATEAVQEQLKCEYAYAFVEKNKYPGAPDFHMELLTEAPFTVGDIAITPIPVMHGKMPVMGFRVGKIAYVTDVNLIPESSLKLLEDLDVLILDALHHTSHHAHFTLEQAIDIAKRLGAKRTFFTHMSHRMGLHHQVNAHLPEGMQLAYDGLEIRSILA